MMNFLGRLIKNICLLIMIIGGGLIAGYLAWQLINYSIILFAAVILIIVATILTITTDD